MPPHHKKNKHCSQCGHCRTWRVNRAFVRATKTNGVVMKHFKTCNRCSRLYRKTGPLTKADFREKYGGSDHVDSDPEDDDDDDDDDEEADGGPDSEPNSDKDHDRGGGPGQGGVGQAITAV